MWGTFLSEPLSIVGLVGRYPANCLYCDGRANMDDFIRFAISEGFTSYGISSHAPLPFSTAWTMEWDRMEDYLSEFSRLKKKYDFSNRRLSRKLSQLT